MQDETIEMARQAGIDEWWDSGNEQREVLQEHLEAFAKLVADVAAAKEREACAKVCDDIGMFHEVSQGSDVCFGLAKAIRSRGKE